MASSDVFATGSIKNSASEMGATKFYSGQQVGAGTATVIFTDDYEQTPISSWWSIELNRNSLVTTIVYHSVSNRTWTMEPEACIVNNY